MEEISTALVPPEQRVPFWNEVARRMVAPVRVTPLHDAGFSARIRRSALPHCEIVAPVSSPAQIVSDGGEEVGLLNIQVQHAGRSSSTTNGRTCELAEGDFVLFDPAYPIWLEFTEPTQVLVLRLPLAGLADRLPHLRRMAGVPMRGDRGAGALFSLFVRKAWAQLEGGEPHAAEALDEMIWPLLRIAYAEQGGTAPDPSARDERRRALLALVAEQLCDPGLDVHHIAARMGVTPRYVQMLFAEIGTTPTAYIQQQRLDLAGDRFAREGARCSVTAVAFDVGFNDLSSFCRAFRRRFDVAPREYRAGLRRSGGTAARALSS